ncbi:hypothetical protein JCM19236_4037 [Vibrio sp. JCM 19236]|nr:hypothetical protein JCM19236_4037 [Vibrio sp. JCM 19236]
MSNLYEKLVLAAAILASTSAFASIETKDWHDQATPEAQQFVMDNIAIDFYASPFQTGWDKDSDVAKYIDLLIHAVSLVRLLLWLLLTLQTGWHLSLNTKNGTMQPTLLT